MRLETQNPRIQFNRESENFEKSFPFRISSMVNENITGTCFHTHDYMQIWYVMSGYCEHWINHNSYQLVKGNLFVLPPYMMHKVMTDNSEDLEIIGCEFSTSFINENISGSDKNTLFDFAYLEPFLIAHESVKPRLHLCGKSQMRVEELLWDMLEEYEQEKEYYKIHIKADLLKLMAIIAREYEDNSTTSYELFSKYRKSVHNAIMYIDNHFSDNLYIEDVCKIAMMSQTYFSYLFKQVTHKTFVEYLNEIRVNKAIQLLKEGRETVTDICFAVGFNDTTYFYRVFKKITGLSPRQYRNLTATR